MKKNIILRYLLILSFIYSFQSCNDELDSEFSEANTENIPWQADTHIKIQPVKDKEAFIWLTNVITLEQFWGNDTVELNLALNSVITNTSFSKIDFYLTAQEKDGYNYTPPYDTTGKLLTSITEIPEDGKINLKIKADDVYELFKNDFVNPRPEAPLLAGDLFELHWIITNVDGSVLNSNDFIEGEYRFGFTTLYKEKKPPSWEGTFDYEWIYVSDGAEEWGGVAVGDKGQITIEELTDATETQKVFDVSHLLFNYNYGGPGKLYLDFNTGETYVEGNSEEKWVISNVDGPTLEISWTYKYSEDYDEYGTVRLTRTDGEDWPENFHSPQTFPWGGKFNYEWIAATPDAENYGGIKIGDTGITNITDAGPGTYNVDHLLFGYNYGGAGTLTYDEVSGLTTIQGEEGEKWVISNVNGASLEISWEYEYSADYNEYGTVRLTRTDGKEWPSNIHTE